MSLLRSSISPGLAHDVAEFLGRCQSPDGGFGGETNPVRFSLIFSQVVYTISHVINIGHVIFSMNVVTYVCLFLVMFQVVQVNFPTLLPLMALFLHSALLAPRRHMMS